MSGVSEPTPAELHLGDRLAALIDGELEHESRERVLSHLATCPGCKAEADAQRSLKSVFAGTAPPPPSDGLLARLQGLPATGPVIDTDLRRPGSDPSGSGGVDFAYPPTVHSGLSGGALGVFGTTRGFRTHRGMEAERALARGRRFAFAAAGAFSLAAVALGGAFTSGQGSAPGTTTVAPPRAPAAGVERSDRRGEQPVAEVVLSSAVPQTGPTTHSGALRLPGGEPPQSGLPALRPGVDGAAVGVAGQPGGQPRLGSPGTLLSPPLIRAAHQVRSAQAGRSGLLRSDPPLLQALPSANGSPAGPSAAPALGDKVFPMASTLAVNPRP